MRDTGTVRVRENGSGLLAALLAGTALVLTMAAAASAQNPVPPAPSVAPPSPNTTYAVGKGVKVQGIIASRNGDQFTVRDPNTHLITLVTIVSGTRVFSPEGPLHLDKVNQSANTLIPGLAVTVYGSGGQDGNLIADRIAFRQSSLKVAAQINAGEVDLRNRQEEIAAHARENTDMLNRATARAREVKDSLDESLKTLNSRIANLDSYDVKETGTVNFATGSAKLSPEAKETLDGMVARNQTGGPITVEILGFASTTGSVALNQRLSQARASAVEQYLAEHASVPVRRLGNTVGLGTSRPVASNDTEEGRLSNQRVEVRVLVNRGISQP